MGMTVQKGPAKERTQQITNVAPHIHHPQTNQARIPVYQIDASAIQDLLTQATAAMGGSTSGGSQEYKKDAIQPDFKLLEGEKHRMRMMCGLEDTAGDECFPKCYRDLFTKHQYKKDKVQLIATAIEKCYIFDDSEVLLYPNLAKKNVKSYCAVSNTRKRAALVNADRVIPPFAMVNLTEEDVALMKQYYEGLLSASLVSTPEVKSTCKKLVATTPSESKGFIMALERFANLLFALISSS